MAASRASGDGSCGYCMQTLRDMTDPRQLPCGHVCCLECVRQDFSVGSKDTKCPSCSAVHRDIDLDELATISTKKRVALPRSKYPPLACTYDKEEAVCFCRDCNARMCLGHKNNHDSFMGKGHKYVPFDEYRRLPARYEKPVCSTHNKYLTLVCETCDELFCADCNLNTRCASSRQTSSHKLISLKKAERKFKEEYEVYIKEISEKHSRFSKKQKDTWDRFDHLVTNYNEEEKLKAIDQFATQQVEEIQRRVKEKKELVKYFPEALDAAVTEYSDELRGKEEQLSELHTSLSRQLREMHIVEVIKRNKANKTKIEEVKQLTLGACDKMKEMVVAPTGLLPDLQVDLRSLYPRKLAKISKSPTSRKVSLMTLTDRGDILCYWKQETVLALMDMTFKITKASFQIKGIVSLVQHKSHIFLASYTSNRMACIGCNYELSVVNQLFTFRTERPSNHHMLVLNDQLVVLDNSSYSCKLHFYDLSGKALRCVELKTKFSAIFPLPSGKVLFKMDSSTLVSQNVTEGRPADPREHPIQALTNCIATDSAGLIYHSSYTLIGNQVVKVSLRDSTEEQTIELETEEYNKHLTEINIKGTAMAVRDSDGNVCLYHIEY